MFLLSLVAVLVVVRTLVVAVVLADYLKAQWFLRVA
jgi:hypothetical protein